MYIRILWLWVMSFLSLKTPSWFTFGWRSEKGLCILMILSYANRHTHTHTQRERETNIDIEMIHLPYSFTYVVWLGGERGFLRMKKISRTWWFGSFFLFFFLFLSFCVHLFLCSSLSFFLSSPHYIYLATWPSYDNHSRKVCYDQKEQL